MTDATTLHEHPRSTLEERPSGPSADGTVVVEVGGDRGAAVIYTDGDLDGEEIEIRPAREEWRGTHTAIRERRVAGRVLFAAVFGSLSSGEYELRIRHGRPDDLIRPLAVIGGHVTEITWVGKA